MIPCIRLWSDAEGRSRVERGGISTPLGRVSGAATATELRFEESAPHASLDWHVAPQRQFVITLAGRLEFLTRDGERFGLDSDTVLLAEDTVGTGHRWSSSGETGWRRAYVVLGDGPVPFVPKSG